MTTTRQIAPSTVAYKQHQRCCNATMYVRGAKSQADADRHAAAAEDAAQKAAAAAADPRCRGESAANYAAECRRLADYAAKSAAEWTEPRAKSTRLAWGRGEIA